MSAAPIKYYTPAEYLALERSREFKSEYFAGEIFAMAGATEPHNLVVGNLVTALNVRLRGIRCRVYPSAMRVKIPRTGLYTYPDVTVVCGEPEFEDESRDTLLNPLIVFEVLSKSTEAYDRGKKFEHYRKLPSLAAFVMISQDRPLVEHFARQADEEQWLLTAVNNPERSVPLPALNCELALSEIYDKVEFQGH